MRIRNAALLAIIFGFTACVADEPGDDVGDGDLETESWEVVGIKPPCSYVAPTCGPERTLWIDYAGTHDMCVQISPFGRGWSDVTCPADHPVLFTQPGADRCGLASCTSED